MECSTGFYQNKESTSECISCKAGTYQPNLARKTCLSCIRGYFCPKASSVPIPCGNKTLFCPANSSVALSVEKGYYSLPATEEKALVRESQEICPRGYACSAGIKSNCDKEGEFADELGLNVCKLAPPGTVPNSARTGLSNCTSGTYSIGTKSNCTSCDANKFSSERAAFCNPCSSCGVGESIKKNCTSSSDSECGECEAGTASTGIEVGGCKPCGDGFYSSSKAG